MTKFSILLLACFTYLVANTQSLIFKSTPDSIEASSFSSVWKNSWAGGMNATQASSIDVDLDGIDDLIFFDRSGNSISVFLVKQTGNNVNYIYTDEFDHLFPPVRDWMLMFDYDNDGHKDIFTYQPGGIRIYRNTTGNNSEISFQLIRPSNTPVGAPLHSLYTNNYVNLFVSSVNTPALYDVDGDGDMDILTFGSWGTTLHYHRNMSMEKYGHADSLDFELRNQCWGWFSEAFASNSLSLFDTCQWNVPNPEFNPDDLTVQGGNRHEGATLCPLDAYNNGLTDLIIGDVDYKSLTLLKNGGTLTNASAVDQDNTFPSYNVPVNLPEFPGAFYVDVDNDGIKDLIVSPNQTLNAQNFESVWFYKNIGENNNPNFQFQKTNFMQEDMIDVGEGAIPVFVDINQDGLEDLIISNFKYYDANNPNKQQFMLLLNVGSENSPEFKLIDDDFLNMSQYSLGNGIAPTFADLNNNGKPDMIVGDVQGRLHYFTNTSSGNDISFSLTASPLTNSSGDIIDVGDFASPHLVDLNRNGKQDLIVGSRHGNIWHFRNSGNLNTPIFTFVTDSLGKLTTAPPNRPNNGNSTPIIKEVDGHYHLIVGSLQGELFHYTNLDNNLTGAFDLKSSQLITYKGTRIYPTATRLYETEHLTLVLGNLKGGLSLFTQEVLAADFEVENKEICVGDTISFTDLSSSSPLSWNWTFEGGIPETSNEQNPQITYLEPGVYDVTLSVNYPNDNSTITQQGYIIVNEVPNIEINETNALICASNCDGALEASATGSEPFSFTWSNGSTVSAINGLCFGEHSVVVLDANGCKSSATFELIAPEVVLNYDLTLTPASCGNFDGCAEIDNISGGTLEPLSVLWPDETSDNSYCDLYAGVYYFQIKDGNDCVFDETFEIINPNAPIVTVNANDVTCEGMCDGQIFTSVQGGTSPYTYNYNNGLSNGPNHGNLCEIDFSLIVVDDELCQSSPENISIGYQYKNPIASFEASDTLIDLISVSTIDFTNTTQFATDYLWDFGDGNTSTDVNPSNTYTEPGTYEVILTADNGAGLCVDVTSRTIIVESSVSAQNIPDSYFKIYPNPSSEVVNIISSTNNEIAYFLFDVTGKIIESGSFKNKTNINVKNLAKGMYIINLHSANNTNDSFKLVVE